MEKIDRISEEYEQRLMEWYLCLKESKDPEMPLLLEQVEQQLFRLLNLPVSENSSLHLH